MSSAKAILPARSHQAVSAFAPLQREFDRALTAFERNLGAFDLFSMTPRMDYSETHDAVELTVDVPGFKEGDIDIALDGDVLTVSGESRSEAEKKTKKFHLTERLSGAFVRSVRLPRRVNAEKIHAKLQDGVLKITAPKSGPDTSRKIEIQTKA